MTNTLIGMVGDLCVDRERPPEAFDRVGGLLAAPDILFGNLEGAFADDPVPPLGSFAQVCPKVSNLAVFGEVGFDVLSMANNHIVDAGHAALLDNISRLRRQGVTTCGAGATLAEARTPGILDTNGLRIAFLAYASIFPMGYEARATSPGLAPMRAYDVWRPFIDNYYAPGTLPVERTIPDETDLARLAEDIAAARRQADLVFTSFHWGDFLRPFHLTDHETRTARWCIDQGVDMVIGHHHHALRGAEWYKGKPIFYGLGHFVFDLRQQLSAEAKAMQAALGLEATGYVIAPREGWPLLPLHPDTRMTMFAYARAGRDGVSDIGFVPCRLRPDGRVEAVDLDSDEGREVVAYLERCNTSQRLDTRITAEGAPEIGGHRSLRLVAGR